MSLNDELITDLSPNNLIPVEDGKTLRGLLEANDFDGFAETLRRISRVFRIHGILSEIWPAMLNFIGFFETESGLRR